MAITKQLKAGNPADDAEIVSGATNQGKLDDNTTGGAACVDQRIETTSDSNQYFDAKKAFTYSSGTWQFIHDETRGDQNTLVQLRIVVASASGGELRTIHNFGQVSITAGGADQTFTTSTVGAQTLTSTERLAVLIFHDGADGERMETGVDNVTTACDSRLLTPDEEVAGAPPSSVLFERRRIVRIPLALRR